MGAVAVEGSGAATGVAVALLGLANLARYAGECGEAWTLLARSLSVFRGAGDKRCVAWALEDLGMWLSPAATTCVRPRTSRRV